MNHVHIPESTDEQRAVRCTKCLKYFPSGTSDKIGTIQSLIVIQRRKQMCYDCCLSTTPHK